MAEVQSPGSFNSFVEANSGVGDEAVLLYAYTEELAAYRQSVLEEGESKANVLQSPGSFQDFIDGNTGVEDTGVLLDSYTDELIAYREALAEAKGIPVEQLRLGGIATRQAVSV